MRIVQEKEMERNQEREFVSECWLSKIPDRQQMVKGIFAVNSARNIQSFPPLTNECDCSDGHA